MLTKKEENQIRENARAIVSSFFINDEGEPFILTDTQCDIFNLIFLQLYPRCQVVTATQYGKSTVVALALIIASQTFKQDFVVLAGSGEKAQIIMDKVIDHTFDSKEILSQLEYDKTESLERIKRKKTREHITWKRGGSIRILSADTRNRKRIKEALTGHGEKRIIAEEASLIPDDTWGMVMRMLGGIEGTFLLKIGNAVYRNHFYRSFKSRRYKKIVVDYKKAIREGRFTKEYIDEMRNEMDKELFRNFYECKFPPRDEIDDKGFRFLLSEETLEKAFVRGGEIKKGKLGGDIGEGNDESVFVLRDSKLAKIVEANKIRDTMQQIPVIDKLLPNITEGFVDAVGVGAGVASRCAELNYPIYGVKWGEAADDPSGFLNKRAENFWGLKRWIENGGKIVYDKKLEEELKEIKYKIRSDKVIMIEPKEEIKKRIRRSPDRADALALTFNKKIKPEISFI